MASVVHGPGNREGQAAALPPRPKSPWECLADHAQAMEPAQRRRAAMLILHVVCQWRLDDVGSLFDLHKGHVCREVERARLEAAELLRQNGIDLTSLTERNERLSHRLQIRLTPSERRATRDMAGWHGMTQSDQAREWMLDGGLRRAMEPDHTEPIEDDDAL